MMGSIGKIRSMAGVNLCGQVVTITKVSFRLMREMVMALCDGEMAVIFKDNGSEVFNTA